MVKKFDKIQKKLINLWIYVYWTKEKKWDERKIIIFTLDVSVFGEFLIHYLLSNLFYSF